MRISALVSLVVFSFVLTAAAADTPNIVLFLADDQGWTGTSVQMDNRVAGSKSDLYLTPALERLAREGMRFSNAYAPHPNCSPTRMSIQTGKSPVRLGSTDIIDVVPSESGATSMFYDRFFVNKPMVVPLPISGLPEEEITIAELLKKANPNYATAHFGKWHMAGGSPDKHGYDQHDGATGNREGSEGPPNPKRTRGITKRSLAFMEEQAAAGKPFFLQISHYAVHTPIRAMPETIAEYEARPAGKWHKNTGYGAMTEELDDGLGAVIAKLDELGVAGNTYLIYTSDNGGEITRDTTSNKPLAKGKTHVWEGGIRVPMLVRGPGIKPGSVSHAPVIGWDLLPTIADMIGIETPLPANLDGGSMLAVLKNAGKGKVARPTEEFVWYYPHYRDMKDVRPQAAIRVGDYKLIKEYESGKVYLYDLAGDLGEERDLAGRMKDRAAALDKRLEDYLTAVNAKRPKHDPNYDPAKDKGNQPFTRQRPANRP